MRQTLVLFLFTTILIFNPITIFSQDKTKNQITSPQADIWELLGNVVTCISEEKYEDALKDIQKAIQLQPENAELYRLEGQILEMLGQIDRAITAWENCILYSETDSIKTEAQFHINSLK